MTTGFGGVIFNDSHVKSTLFNIRGLADQAEWISSYVWNPSNFNCKKPLHKCLSAQYFLPQ